MILYIYQQKKISKIVSFTLIYIMFLEYNITKLIYMNGLYDILCGISILVSPYIRIPLFNCIHSNMINNESIDILTKNYLAYWILTYGIMRLYIYDVNILIVSYIIEAVCFSNELYFKRIHKIKGIFTITISLYIAIYLYIIN